MLLTSVNLKKKAARGLVGALLCAAALIGVSLQSAQAADTIEVFSYNGARQESTVTVPVNPQRVAVIDYAVLDILDSLGLSDRVKGTAKGAAPDYLMKYVDDPDIVNVGTVKEVSLERLMEIQPDVIFIGARLATQYDALSQIAPVVYLGVDYELGVPASVRRSCETVAEIFGIQDSAVQKLDAMEQRVQRIAKAAAGRSAVIGMATAGSFKTLGNNGRCAFITNEAGFVNAAPEVSATHGNESSFELVYQLDPEFIFVLDRDSAIGVKGAKLAQDLMDNELINKTRAAKEGNIVYLNAAVWYLSEGGLTAEDQMLSDLETALGLN